MSVNKYTTQDGLQTLANGSRIWVGTKQSYDAQKQTGTMPNDVLVAITDDEQDGLETLIPKNAGARNSIFRGQYLGSEVTSEQYDAIDAGTFDGLFIGDYWTIDGVNYRIAAFDYWIRTGNTECTKHHVVIVPDTNFTGGRMNDTATTAGGYVGSKMYTTYLATVRNTITTAFGSSHILSHKEFFTKEVTDGKASSWDWYDSTIDLMNECMVCGHNIYGSHPGFETGIDMSQLALFSLMPGFINTRSYWWLRSIASASSFVMVDSWGCYFPENASSKVGIRPAFAICKSN